MPKQVLSSQIISSDHQNENDSANEASTEKQQSSDTNENLEPVGIEILQSLIDAQNEAYNAKRRVANMDPNQREKINRQHRESYARRKERDPEAVKAATKKKREKYAIEMELDPFRKEIRRIKDRERQRKKAKERREREQSTVIASNGPSAVSAPMDSSISNNNNEQAGFQTFESPEPSSHSAAIPDSEIPNPVAWVEDQVVIFQNNEFPLKSPEPMFCEETYSQTSTTSDIPGNVISHTTSSFFNQSPSPIVSEKPSKKPNLKKSEVISNINMATLTVRELITIIQSCKAMNSVSKALHLPPYALEDLLLKHFFLMDETIQNKFSHESKATVIFELLWTLSPNEISSIFGETLDQPLLNNKWEFCAHPNSFQCLYRNPKFKYKNLLNPNSQSVSKEAKIKCRRLGSDTNDNNQDKVVIISSRMPRERSNETPTEEQVSSRTNSIAKRKQKEIAQNKPNMNQNSETSENPSKKPAKKKNKFAEIENRLNSMTVNELINHFKGSFSLRVAAKKFEISDGSLEQFLLNKFILADEATENPIKPSNRGDIIFVFLRSLSEAQLKSMFDKNLNQPIADNKWEFRSDEDNFEIFNKENKNRAILANSTITIKCRKTSSNLTSQANDQGNFVSITFRPYREDDPMDSFQDSIQTGAPENVTHQTPSNFYFHTTHPSPISTEQLGENSTAKKDERIQQRGQQR